MMADGEMGRAGGAELNVEAIHEALESLTVARLDDLQCGPDQPQQLLFPKAGMVHDGEALSGRGRS